MKYTQRKGGVKDAGNAKMPSLGPTSNGIFNAAMG